MNNIKEKLLAWAWPMFRTVELIQPEDVGDLHRQCSKLGKAWSTRRYFAHEKGAGLMWWNLKGHNLRHPNRRLYQEDIDNNYWWTVK